MASSKYVAENLYFNYYIANEFNLHGTNDMEFQNLINLVRNANGNLYYGKVDEIRGNMFTMFPEYSLATSVSADFEMNIGVLRKFKATFNNVDRLKAENVRTGGVAFLEYDNKFVYYLVVKPVYYMQPTYYSVWLALKGLKDHVVANNVRKLAITQIGSGPDSLRWVFVKQMMEDVFKDVDIEIKAVDLTFPLNNNYEVQ